MLRKKLPKVINTEVRSIPSQDKRTIVVVSFKKQNLSSWKTSKQDEKHNFSRKISRDIDVCAIVIKQMSKNSPAPKWLWANWPAPNNRRKNDSDDWSHSVQQ